MSGLNVEGCVNNDQEKVQGENPFTPTKTLPRTPPADFQQAFKLDISPFHRKKETNNENYNSNGRSTDVLPLEEKKQITKQVLNYLESPSIMKRRASLSMENPKRQQSSAGSTSPNRRDSFRMLPNRLAISTLESQKTTNGSGSPFVSPFQPTKQLRRTPPKTSIPPPCFDSPTKDDNAPKMVLNEITEQISSPIVEYTRQSETICNKLSKEPEADIIIEELDVNESAQYESEVQDEDDEETEDPQNKSLSEKEEESFEASSASESDDASDENEEDEPDENEDDEINEEDRALRLLISDLEAIQSSSSDPPTLIILDGTLRKGLVLEKLNSKSKELETAKQRTKFILDVYLHSNRFEGLTWNDFIEKVENAKNFGKGATLTSGKFEDVQEAYLNKAKEKEVADGSP